VAVSGHRQQKSDLRPILIDCHPVRPVIQGSHAVVDGNVPTLSLGYLSDLIRFSIGEFMSKRWLR